MGKESDLESCPHPMVPVPDAILCVLTKVAESLLLDDKGLEEQTEILPVFIEGTSVPSLSGAFCCSPVIGRVAAEKIIAPSPYPSFNASIMDGYAVCSSRTNSLDDQGNISFRVVGSVFAGPFSGNRGLDGVIESAKEDNDPDDATAIYVTTGAVVPSPFDCVVPVEDVFLSEKKDASNFIYISQHHLQSMKWIRPIGCDIPTNTTLVEQGDVISSAALGLLVTCGITHIRVRKLPKVGIISTGNELQTLPLTLTAPEISKSGKQLEDQLHMQGLIYDINRPVLLTLLSAVSHAMIPIDYGIAPDDENLLEEIMERALIDCDVIITSGGISAGEKDLLEHILTKRFGAELHFGRLNMKPGKPTTFFTLRETHAKSRTKFLFSLPGNPVSAFVCYHLIVSPALNLLHSGPRENYRGVSSKDKTFPAAIKAITDNATVPTEIEATLAQKLSLDVERPEYHRVSLSWDTLNGRFTATSTGVQRSSRFLSLKGADGLLLLPQGVPGGKMHCNPGESYLCLLLHNQPFISGSLGVKWKDCLHKNTFLHWSQNIQQKNVRNRENISVDICCVNISGDALNLAERVIKESLLANDSTSEFEIKRCSLHSNHHDIRDYLTDASLNETKLCIVVANGRFRENLELSIALSSLLEKTSHSMAMLLRRKMVEKDRLCALFEPVVGWFKNLLVVLLPLFGLPHGLQSFQHLLTHATMLHSK